MRFHKSESAFFAFIALVVAAGGCLAYAYSVIHQGGRALDPLDLYAQANLLTRLIFGAGVLLGITALFGIFFIYPLIRRHLNEEGKLRAMTESLSARSETLEYAALTDGLTGMQNRRYFDDALREYLEEFRRIGKPVGLLVLDLDHFKSVNDTHGHDTGDEVLRAVVAPNMDNVMLTKLAERIRKAIAALIVTKDNVRLKVTTSVGLAVWDGKETADQFYGRADRRLYEAKRQGRNRVCA